MKTKKQSLIQALGILFLDSFKNFIVLWSLLRKLYNHIQAISFVLKYWRNKLFTNFRHWRTDTILQEFSVWCVVVMGARNLMHSQYYIKTELRLYKWAVTVCLFPLSLHYKKLELIKIRPRLAKVFKGNIGLLPLKLFSHFKMFSVWIMSLPQTLKSCILLIIRYHIPFG